MVLNCRQRRKDVLMVPHTPLRTFQLTPGPAALQDSEVRGDGMHPIAPLQGGGAGRFGLTCFLPNLPVPKNVSCERVP